MITTIVHERKYGKEFEEYVQDILVHPFFKSLQHCSHHGIKRSDHSITVAYDSFVFAKKLNLDVKAVARGALLHDFFFDIPLETRRELRRNQKGLKKIKVMQGYTHPQTAKDNAQRFFRINELEVDIIEKHMFPLTPDRPKFKESWIVNGVDTSIAVKDLFTSLLKHPYWTITGKINRTKPWR